MLKLFLVLVVQGHVGGTWGPLPYDMAECMARAHMMKDQITVGYDAAIEAGKAAELHGVLPEEMVPVCVMLPEAPKLGTPYGLAAGTEQL